MRYWTTALLATKLALVARATPSVTTLNGTINGLHLESFEQDVFLGVPFAKPPVDDLRFRNPQVWDTAFDEEGFNATSYGWSCPQGGVLAIGTGASEYQSEDCLTLNVVRSDKDHSDLPVLVYIYGGGYNAGTSSSPIYNLSYIIQESVEIDEPIIAVSLNYRLAALGFLASAEVVASGNANLGLKDQRLALRWVKENIASFGGDPNKITIWGESAGAYSVGLQSLAYGGKAGETGLFRGAIYESGTAVGSRFDVEHLQASYDDIVNQTNCSSSVDPLDCLRALPLDVLYAAAEPYILTYAFMPVIDGDFIPDFPSVGATTQPSLAEWLLQHKVYSRAPIMVVFRFKPLVAPTPSKLLQSGRFDTSITGLVGANSDEGASPFFAWKGINTDEDFYTLLTNSTLNGRNISVDTANQLFDFYPNNRSLGSPYGTGEGGVNFTEYGQQFKRSASFAGDMYMIAPRRYQCEVMTNWSQTVYSFRFHALPERSPVLVTGDIPSAVGHYAEMSFVFGNPNNLTDPYEMSIGTDPAKLALSKDMVRAWVSFTRHLDPNHVLNELPYWPSYAESAANMVFDAGGSFVEADDFRKEGIALINARPGDFIR